MLQIFCNPNMSRQLTAVFDSGWSVGRWNFQWYRVVIRVGTWKQNQNIKIKSRITGASLWQDCNLLYYRTKLDRIWWEDGAYDSATFDHIWSDHDLNLWPFEVILLSIAESSITHPSQFKLSSLCRILAIFGLVMIFICSRHLLNK